MKNKQKSVKNNNVFFRQAVMPQPLVEITAKREDMRGVKPLYFVSNSNSEFLIYYNTPNTPFEIVVLKKNGVQPSMKEVMAGVNEFCPKDIVAAIVLSPQQMVFEGENENYFRVRQIGVYKPEEVVPNVEPASDKIEMEMEGKTFVLPNTEEFKAKAKEFLDWEPKVKLEEAVLELKEESGIL
jgi:hypothetical protein